MSTDEKNDILRRNRAIAEHYDALIDAGNDPVRDPPPLRSYMDRWDGDAFCREVGPDPEKTLLEIGIGTGRLAIRLAPYCKRLVGIDVSEKTLDRAAANLCECTNVTLLCGAFQEYAFGDERFDTIYSSLTFMHIPDKQAAIRKVEALLKRHGRFVLSIDKNQSRTIDLGDRQIEIYPDNPDETANALCSAGLQIVKRLETEFAFIFVSEKE